MLGVADECAFGDLEDEAFEGKLCVLRSGGDVSGKGEVCELGEGDVDRDGEVVGDVFCCGEDGSEEVACELTMEAGFFGERNELVGRDETMFRMLPASEGFEAAEEAGSQFDERLEVRHDLVAFERSAKIAGVVSGHG